MNTQTVPKMNLSMADRALREANGEKGLSIKGASARGNVVQVSGLAKGTTSEDVEVRLVIFAVLSTTKLSLITV